MICYYIKQASEKNRIKNYINYFFNKIVIDQNMVILPNHKISIKKARKIAYILKDNNIRVCILSKDLNQNKSFKNEIIGNNIELLDGKFLYKVILEKIIEYICKKKKIKANKINISVLINDYSRQNKDIIINLAKKVKSLEIITNNVKDFIDVEEYLYNEKGIIIKIQKNNKNKVNGNIIVNMDFCQEDFNKLNIFSKSIIINVLNNIKIKEKRFSGININGYNIIIPNKYRISGFDDNLVYESTLINLQYNDAKEKILEDKIRVKNLIGEKDIIQIEEFIK